ncbi:helix-turn-helix transcriptional regulator [Pseudomonas fluorescens]|uniref:helix-turn-helix domain-containing protein n=1 Tax=Pseudomonas fluorescens TaxID=294 RepID=UPI001CD33CA8
MRRHSIIDIEPIVRNRFSFRLIVVKKTDLQINAEENIDASEKPVANGASPVGSRNCPQSLFRHIELSGFSAPDGPTADSLSGKSAEPRTAKCQSRWFFGIATIAHECGSSRAHFSRAFSRSVGAPPYRWLRTMRIERAKDLLRHSTNTLSEIAVTCGFTDQSHFNRVFRCATGATPGRWRCR